MPTQPKPSVPFTRACKAFGVADTSASLDVYRAIFDEQARLVDDFSLKAPAAWKLVAAWAVDAGADVTAGTVAKYASAAAWWSVPVPAGLTFRGVVTLADARKVASCDDVVKAYKARRKDQPKEPYTASVAHVLDSIRPAKAPTAAPSVTDSPPPVSAVVGAVTTSATPAQLLETVRGALGALNENVGAIGARAAEFSDAEFAELVDLARVFDALAGAWRAVMPSKDALRPRTVRSSSAPRTARQERADAA